MLTRRVRMAAAMTGALALISTVGVATSGGAGARPGPPAPPAALEILLTNDDGVQGGYIDLIRDELCAAGHRVTIVAPSGDQSGNSSRFTSARDARLQVSTSTFPCGSGTGTQHAVASTWSARLAGGTPYEYRGPASPVDAVRFALAVPFKEQKPDVVISGANPGQNLSSVVLKSGTVGATLAAAAKGVPAIALSVAFNPADDFRRGFPASVLAARDLGRWTVRLLAELQAQRGGDGLLPDGVSLNVNHPTPVRNGVYAPEEVGDAVLTVAGRRDLIPIDYLPTGTPGEYSVAITLCGLPGSPAAPCDEPEVRDADTTAIDRNQISVQPMDGDLTVVPPSATGLQRILRSLNR